MLEKKFRSIRLPVSIGCFCAAIALVSVLGQSPVAAQSLRLNKLNAKHYIVQSNLNSREARFYGRHMDAVFSEYRRRFRNANFKATETGRMNLYLFARQRDYLAFLKGYGIDASNSSGMFFISRDIRGLATFVEGRRITEVLSTLQHEGFHQFAYAYIGRELPIWVNEGIAQYFEDGVLVKNRMHLNMARPHRVLQIKATIERNQSIPFTRMLAMTNQQWSTNVRMTQRLASLQYEQAWSMVHFLVVGDGEKYQEAFGQYLSFVGNGMSSIDAFANAFGSADPEPFEKAWKRYALSQVPDDLSAAVNRMQFLARSMEWLQQNNIRLPKTMAGLRNELQKRNFYATFTLNNVEIKYQSSDESLYRYAPRGGNTTMFHMLEAEARDLLPRIYAPGLKPEPTIIWYRDADKNLMSDVVYR